MDNRFAGRGPRSWRSAASRQRGTAGPEEVAYIRSWEGSYELALLYVTVSLMLLLVGPGRLAADQAFVEKKLEWPVRALARDAAARARRRDLGLSAKLG